MCVRVCVWVGACVGGCMCAFVRACMFAGACVSAFVRACVRV